jgi:sialic acid synthase SpsE
MGGKKIVNNTEIIAEIAQGYEGKPVLAELLVKGAITAGADAVKIQLIYADELCVPGYPYYGLFKSLEMPLVVWQGLERSVRAAKKKLYFDIYGDKSLELAKKLKADGVKISATDFYNTELLNKAFKTFPAIFISCSGVPYEDLSALVNRFAKKNNLTLMYGFQAEPTEIKDNHLLRISSLRSMFPGVKIGFMDHSLGSGDEAFYLPVMALTQNVSCIEKHITLDYDLQIEDYISALSVERFAEFVSVIRKMEPAAGSAEFELIDKEIAYKKKAGKVVVAKHDLKKGTILTNADLSLKRVSVTPSDTYFSRKEDVTGKKLSKGILMNRAVENFMIR